MKRKLKEFLFDFYEEGNSISIVSSSYDDAVILAKAERIKKGLRYYSYDVTVRDAKFN